MVWVAQKAFSGLQARNIRDMTPACQVNQSCTPCLLKHSTLLQVGQWGNGRPDHSCGFRTHTMEWKWSSSRFCGWGRIRIASPACLLFFVADSWLWCIVIPLPTTHRDREAAKAETGIHPSTPYTVYSGCQLIHHVRTSVWRWLVWTHGADHLRGLGWRVPSMEKRGMMRRQGGGGGRKEEGGRKREERGAMGREAPATETHRRSLFCAEMNQPRCLQLIPVLPPTTSAMPMERIE